MTRGKRGGEQMDDDWAEKLEKMDPPVAFEWVDGKIVERPAPAPTMVRYAAGMDPAGLPALLDAIRHMHGCEATWLESVPVHEKFKGETVWQGDVQVFAIEHPNATRCYTWSHAVGEGPRRRFYAVPGAGPVVDAVTAVRVAIAAG